MAQTSIKARPPSRNGAAARQSPVRRAHALVAVKHGRAGAPGEFGVPLEAVEDSADAKGTDGRSSNGSGDRGSGRPKSRTAAATRQTTAAKRASSNGRGSGSSGSAKGSAKRAAGNGNGNGNGSSAKAGAGRGASNGRGSHTNAAKGRTKRSAGTTRGKATKATNKKKSTGRSESKPAATSSHAKRDSGHNGGGPAAGSVARTGVEAVRKVAAKALPDAPTGAPTLARLARRSARGAAGRLARKAIAGGAQGAKAMVERAGLSGVDMVGDYARQLPIQRAVDVAVPLELAWDEWMKFNYFPEGAHRVKDVQRDGDHLVGRVGAPSPGEWEAEILEERAGESFAWHSVDGADCAGLVTFHRLGERLTRIELNLDVRPIGVGEAVALALHLADRRAGADLRRFKAHVELIDPATYEEGDDNDDE
jgi:uncharacterized membrane protein